MSEEFSQKVVELMPALNKFAFSLTKNREDAEDLVQETCLRAFDRNGFYQDGTNLKAWLFTILKNSFINDYRRNKKSNIDLHPDLYLLNVCNVRGYDCPESSLNEKDLLKIIDSIPRRLREPFELTLKGFKYEEIAKITNRPIGTIKSDIFHARKRIVEIIENDKIHKTMKNEIVIFRKIVNELLKTRKKGWHLVLNEIVTESKLTWPSFQKAMVTPYVRLNLKNDNLQKIETFNLLHKDIIDKPEPTRDGTLLDMEEGTEVIKEKEYQGKPEEVDNDSNKDIFWISFGHLVRRIPSNVIIHIEIKGEKK